MTPSTQQTQKTISLILVAIVFALWITPGTIGRDLWKADEPYSFGLVNHIVKTGDWVVPTLAGEPFMEKPPLLYITAAFFAKTLSPWLQLHDAARVAVILYMGLCVFFIGLAARELLGKGFFSIAAIMLIGAAGLQETAHKLITDTVMICGISLGLYGLALSRRRHILGGVLLGAGAGVGFMSKGLLAPGMLGITALLLPLLFSAWRKKEYVLTLLAATVSALPWFVIWPLALYMRSPALFHEWFWTQNIGRFMSNSLVGQRHSPFYYLTQLPYFALPAWPLACWALWKARGRWSESVEIHLPLVSFLVMLLVLSSASSIRDIYALPMLLPLTLLATVGVHTVPARVQRILTWIAVVLFGMAAAALWFGYAALVSGVPAAVAKRLYFQQPDYVPHFALTAFALGTAFSLWWVLAVRRSFSIVSGYVLGWTVGIVMVWGLLMTLWLPWFESGSGYQPMLTRLKQQLPPASTHVMSYGLGESERALLEYYTGVLPRRIEINGVLDCDYVLIETGSRRMETPLGKEWKTVWEERRRSKGTRIKEIFTLLERGGGKRQCR